MAQAKIDILIETSKSAKNLDELEKSAADLREELGKADFGTKEYKKLNDQLVQTNKQVKNLELGFEALDNEQVASEIGSVAGAIGDVTSAMILLGGENETLEKVAGNIQTALGVSMAFKGAIEGISSAQKLWTNVIKKYTVVQKIANVVSKAFNVIMRANPIGLIITAVALLITGLIFLAKNVSAVGETFSKMGGWLKTTIDGFGKWKYVILALLGPIGLLIAAWDYFFGEQAKHSAEELARLEAEKKARMKAKAEITKAHQARLKEIAEEKKALEEAHEAQNDIFDRDIRRMEAEGKNANTLKRAKIEAALEYEKEQYRIQEDLIASWTKYYEDQFAVSGKNREDWKKQMLGQGIDIDAIEAERDKRREEQNARIYEATTDLIAFETGIRKEAAETIEEIDEAQADSAEKLAQARLDALDRIKTAEDEYLISKMSDQDQEILAVQDKYQELIQLAIDNGEETKLLEEAQAQAFLEIDQKYADEADAIDAEAKQKKEDRQKEANEVLKQGATDLFNVANDFANALSAKDLKNAQDKTARGEALTKNEIKRLQRQDKINKAFALAQIAADTARGISGAIAAGAGLPFPANLGAIASGVAAVLSGALQASQVLGESVDIPTPASTSESVDSGSGDSAQNTPQIDPLGFGSTLLNQPNKVYVTETDITGVQNKVATLEQAASFG